MASGRVAILVYGDVEDAAFELLIRDDVDLRWAMSLDEASAVTRVVRPPLVLTSDAFALSYLEANRSVGPATLVLIHELERWSSVEVFRDAGALGLVGVHDRAGVVAAISEVTGIPFRVHGRIPWRSVVDTQFDGRTRFLDSIDLSVSGISLVGFPRARRGDRAELTFDVGSRLVTVTAAVVRTFEFEGRSAAGLSFVSLTPEDRERVLAEVYAEQKQVQETWGRVRAPRYGAGTQTLDLVRELGHDESANFTYFDMLRAVVRKEESMALPRWLERIRTSLVREEVRMLLGQPSCTWAETTIRMRIDLGRQALNRDAEMAYSAALDLCTSLTETAAGSPDDVLAQVAQIRADLLRAIGVSVACRPESNPRAAL
ncbi:MAG: PilZ domain-containing protein [Deltaproteobacteria bacterium]|nr:PilZ domain-containing protein [Deltaproteobacteria bacterium]